MLFFYGVWILAIVALFYFKKNTVFQMNWKIKFTPKATIDFLIIFFLCFLFANFQTLFVYKTLSFSSIDFFIKTFGKYYGYYFLSNVVVIFLVFVLPEEIIYRYLFTNFLWDIFVTKNKRRKILSLSFFCLLFFISLSSPDVVKITGYDFIKTIVVVVISSVIFSLLLLNIYKKLKITQLKGFILLMNIIFFTCLHTEQILIPHGFIRLYAVLSYLFGSFILIKFFYSYKSIIYPIWIHFWYDFWMILPKQISYISSHKELYKDSSGSFVGVSLVIFLVGLLIYTRVRRWKTARMS